MATLLRISLLALFVGWISLTPQIVLGQDRYENEELVIIGIKEDAPQVNELFFQVSWGDMDAKQARQAGFPYTGLVAFDSLGVRFGLLWIERFWAADIDPITRNQGAYVLHFPLGSSVETIIAAYVQLPFLRYAEPGRVPIEVPPAKRTAVEHVTWGRVKHRMRSTL
jgi:hypothetical protein